MTFALAKGSGVRRSVAQAEKHQRYFSAEQAEGVLADIPHPQSNMKYLA